MVETFPPQALASNLQDYDATRKDFRWEQVEQDFTWSRTGQLNIAYEAIDRHVAEGRGDKVALYYKDADRAETYTFRQMRDLSNRFANVLRAHQVGKGDRVFLFLPRGPELVIALFGILKVGAIAGPQFEAFMEDAIRSRLEDSGAVALVTTETLKQRVPRAEVPDLKHVFLVGEDAKLENGEMSYDSLMAEASDECAIEWMDHEDAMCLFYTSGSTGRPKGVVHVHHAMIHQYQSSRWVLDLQPDDIYWCTADQGWITGTSMGIMGPWLCGNSIVIRGGRYSAEDWYQTLESYGVTVWFSAPTAFRMLMAAGDKVIRNYNLSHLRHILSAGEPLNPEVLRWAKNAYGVRIHDNWWMTETGAPMVSNYPSLPMRLGSMGKPLPGIETAILDDDGLELPIGQMGNLAARVGWPGMVRAIWNNPDKYQQYFQTGGWFISGDSAFQDKDGYFWSAGRVDDVINTSGERVGPFEIESCLVEHPAVAEAGVIGKPDELRGEIIKAFISLRRGYTPSTELEAEITTFVKTRLASHAAPREIEFVDKLPKTRSGKIMRRVLKAWELQLPTGDLSTMED